MLLCFSCNEFVLRWGSLTASFTVMWQIWHILMVCLVDYVWFREIMYFIGIFVYFYFLLTFCSLELILNTSHILSHNSTLFCRQPMVRKQLGELGKVNEEGEKSNKVETATRYVHVKHKCSGTFEIDKNLLCDTGWPHFIKYSFNLFQGKTLSS